MVVMNQCSKRLLAVERIYVGGSGRGVLFSN